MRQRGEPILIRYRQLGRVFWALPATVVEETPERVIVWLADRTVFKRPPVIRVPIPKVVAGNWSVADAEWEGGGALIVAERGPASSVWIFPERNERPWTWYVNLEEPWQESPLGYDTRDQVLDVYVAADRSWHWKDEGEFAEAQQLGLFAPEQAAAIRAEGVRAIERIEAWAPPFCEGWERWRPDPAWPMPALPEGWDGV